MGLEVPEDGQAVVAPAAVLPLAPCAHGLIRWGISSVGGRREEPRGNNLGSCDVIARGNARSPTRSLRLSRLIRTDFHIHSNLSDCGDPAATLEAILGAGLDAGLDAIGISDHVFFSQHLERVAIARRHLPREQSGMRIYVGCEADMQSPTRAAIDAEFAQTLDYVMVSASHLYDPGVKQEFIDEPRSMAAYMLKLTRGAIELGFVDIIVHPFHVPASRYSFADFVQAAEEAEVRSVARMAAEAEVGMECNPRFVKAAPAEAARLFGLFLEEGCLLAINSDAHHPTHVGCRGRQFATEEELRAMGIGEEHLFSIEQPVTEMAT